MDLKIKNIVDLLQISEKTVYRWIKEKKIPCYKINHQYRFNKSEINEWILSNKIELSSTLMDMSIAGRATNFYDLLKNGGIHNNIKGNSISEVLHNSINTIHTPGEISKEKITDAILDREGLMTTAIGKGLAIPHPRNPILTNIKDASISICHLENPIDFQALDGEKVHTIFILLTYSSRRHLEVLTKISFLCQIDSFVKMLRDRAPEEEIFDFIKTKELEWYNKEFKQ